MIKNKVTNCPTINWNIIKTWEFNQLKDNTNRNVEKLKNSILKNGFIAPFDCYKNDKKNYVFDGTGRYLALLQLETEGIEIPELPVLFIQAKDLKEAKKYALQKSSTHGDITQDSLSEFVNFDFTIDELKDIQIDELNIAELDYMLLTDDFNNNNENDDELDIDFDNIKSNKDREKQFKEQLVTCPHCDGKFNIQV